MNMLKVELEVLRKTVRELEASTQGLNPQDTGTKPRTNPKGPA